MTIVAHILGHPAQGIDLVILVGVAKRKSLSSLREINLFIVESSSQPVARCQRVISLVVQAQLAC